MTGEFKADKILEHLEKYKGKKIHIHTNDSKHHKQTTVILTIPYSVCKPK
jgi:hypothetical protein